MSFSTNKWCLLNIKLQWVFAMFLLGSCAAPRTVIHSGKVTPQGQVKAGVNSNLNIATQPIDALSDITTNLVNTIKSQDSVVADNAVADLMRAMVAYTLDPPTAGFDIYLRYGIVPRVDAGYKYTFGAHVVDVMYQFMGSTGSPEEGLTSEGLGTYGSVGLQFSRQRAELPAAKLLDDAADLLKFEATRTDFLVPFVFSKSFGHEENRGNISYGVAYNHSFISYTFQPSNLFQEQANQQELVKIRELSAKKNYGSLGAFANAKVGFKYAYLLPALAVYYQNYGTYTLPGGRSTKLSGFTFVPSIGLQFQFGKGR